MNKRFSIPLLFCLALPAAAANLTTAQAKDHVGEVATVCGEASGVHTAESAKGQPTFINLDGRYPNNAFTVLIWGDRKAAFGDLQKFTSGKVCATGKIQLYHDKPEIVVDQPEKMTKQ